MSSVNIDEQAKRLLAIAIARQARTFVSGGTATTARVRLSESAAPVAEMKSRIIGKEGKNARTFEERSGVDLLIHEDPEAVVLSSFDPYRREVARLALESLIRDGRINPVRIEETLAKAKDQVENEIREQASKALKLLKIENIHPAIVRVLGTLSIRLSSGQNLLEHAVECAQLCGTLAAELGFDAQLARRAALLHDVGKALDPVHEGSHAAAGAAFAEKYGESPEVVHAIAAHHEEVAPESWLDHLVIAADALSGARPGARHGATQGMLDRSEAMEALARSLPGVTEAYAVQSGRELRVFVDCEKINDDGARELARQVVRKIEAEVRFPGQIKVTVLREMRVTEVAAK